jgi:hypothetical protein
MSKTGRRGFLQALTAIPPAVVVSKMVPTEQPSPKVKPHPVFRGTQVVLDTGQPRIYTAWTYEVATVIPCDYVSVLDDDE